MDPGPAYKRRRPAVACTECRRRKVRCDRASPCGPCDKSGFRCVYHNNPSDRMQQDMFAQLGYGQSILKPNMADLGDMDMLPMDMTYLNDDSSLGFIDYFSLNISPTENESLYSAASQLDGEGFNWMTRMNRAPKGPSSLVSSTPSTSDSITTGAFGFGSSESGSLFMPSLGSANSISGLASNASSSSPSPASLQPTSEPNEDSERRWQDAFYRCERLQFLASVVNRSDDSQLTSSDAMVRSLMKRFTKLDRVAQKNWETQAMSPHNTLSWPPMGSLPGSTGRSLLPPRETCDILLDTYINTFESVLRILHVPSFQREYKRFWSNPTSLSMDEDEAFACKLMIILALGSVVCSSRHILDSSARRQGVSLRQQARGWIVHARQWLGSKIFAQADLDNVQTRCLLALARHTHQHTLPAGAVWFPGDQDLTRVGIQMGLHREPRVRFPNMSAKEAEIRRRLWATMLELSLQMCFDEGLPAPISPESYDCEPPSSITDEDLESEDINIDKKASAERLEFTPSIVQVLLARTQRLRLQILQRVNAPGASSKAYEESHKLAAQLNTFCCTGLDMLRSTKKATNFQIKLLDVFTRPFVLALHEPFADRAATDPTYYYSRKMRMEVSALLLANPLLAIPAPNTGNSSIDSGLDLSGPANSSNTYVRPPGIDACAALSTQGHGHFALVQRQATAALCLDLISELEEKSFPSTDGAGWEKLRGTIRHAVLGYERRVRAADGTHSTHEFLFFACAEAYIEALLRGYHSRDADEAIAEAARTALAVCCEVMKRQRQGSRTERSGEGETGSQIWLTSDHEDGYTSDGEII